MKKRNLGKFNQIAKDIKNIKIQGARNIAKAALYAYSLLPTKQAKRKLISLRPTEPMLVNVLNKIGKQNYKEILKHFDEAQEEINKNILKIIKDNDKIICTGKLSKNTNEIGMIYVNSNFQRKKNGTKMMQFLESLAKKKKKKETYVHALYPAIGFYKKLGYKLIKCKNKDSCLMTKEIRGN